MSALLIAVNCLVFLFLGGIWKRDDVFNTCLKFVLWALFICNAIEMMNVSGYIVRMHP